MTKLWSNSLKKNLPTAVRSNQSSNSYLVLPQCLVLPLLIVKQATFGKQIKRELKSICFLFRKYIYIFKNY